MLTETPREISLYGLLMPTLLPIAISVAALFWVLDTALGRFGAYQYVWHPPLFRFSLFVCLFVAAARAMGQ